MTPIIVTTSAGAPGHSTKPLTMVTPELGPTASPSLTANMAESHKRSASAPAVIPNINNSDNKDPATTAPAFLGRATTRVVEYLHPAPLRQEYRDIATALARSRYAYHFIFLGLLFALAEYEQPGWFPRPEELSAAVVGFLCAGFLIFPVFALLEYFETHTWPWQDEGFVWPWEALLWSGTVYSDDTFGDSVAAYRNSYLESSPAVVGREEEVVQTPIKGIAKEGDSTIMAVEDASTTTEGFPKRPEMIIPPTPFLPRGLRPFHLPPPVTHHSGLLGESPVPNKFKHFSRNSKM